ncbi:lipopolysaccharide biosynthesis protein [Caldicellulosiruptor saccharolyticus DSM 8903]|uniref:Lipopolysaccharide biosynthesis protein n=1 Tax=Caldicellulosiruptor saccharolyticus (strain ATCC 43494 / DSM 8903 / Tp8T 6331) TaxID=351627 RepID=A4XKF1_CALS8|nr:LPS biosynthesis protein [Caldicellulosiruptor saccharolyticus]ABP67386.1 lipopolysaccharide biosynthesis protein [Caldicellulosiruptor saccharolyticus DSM 8903]
MNEIFKKRIKELVAIVLIFMILSLVVVQFFTRTLWTAEINLRLDNNLLNPLSFNMSSPSISNIVQGLYSNITSIDLNKEYLEMVALNPPFIDYVTSKYGEDERFGVFVEPKASKSGVNYIVVKAVADSSAEAENMLNKYMDSLNKKVLTDLKNRSDAAQKLLNELLRERQKYDKLKLTTAEQEQYSQISSAINLIKWFNENYNKVVDLKSAIDEYGRLKIYESAGSKFEKAVRVVAGTFAGVIIAVLYVIFRERRYILSKL